MTAEGGGNWGWRWEGPSVVVAVAARLAELEVVSCRDRRTSDEETTPAAEVKFDELKRR